MPEISVELKVSSPEDRASFFRRLFFHWVGPLVRVGRQRVLQENDLLPLASADSSAESSGIFAGILHERKAKNHGQISAKGLVKVLLTQFHAAYLPIFCLAVFSMGVSLLVPWFIRALVGYLGSAASAGTEFYSYQLAIGMGFCALVTNIAIHHVYHYSLKLGMRMRAALEF